MPLPSAEPASLRTFNRAMAWAEMAKGNRRIGTIRSRNGATGRRHYICFGRHGKIYSFRGVRFESKHMAEAILSHIEVEHAKGLPLEDILSEFQPEASSQNAIQPLVEQWIDRFEQKEKLGKRSENSLRELRRWARAGGHFSWWYGCSLFEVDELTVEDWSLWLSSRRVQSGPRKGQRIKPKTVHNVMAGFHSFLTWARKKRKTFEVPRFEWPEPDDHIPTILSLELQQKVLDAIPEPKRGIFLACARLGIRPGEARAVPVCDWRDEQLIVRKAVKGRTLSAPIRGPKKPTGTKTLPLPADLREWLERYVPPGKRLSRGFLFENPDGTSSTRQWSETSFRRTWYTACRKVGVRVSPYEGTKHSMATALKSAGVDDRTLAKILGHRDPRSVEKYGKIQNQAVRSALSRLRPEA